MPGDVLATITGHPPPLEEEAHTRAWIEVDEAPVEDVSTGSSSSSNASGVASRDGRVAAMRELYARGDADGALALAASLGDALVPGALGDHPDASIVVEFGEQSIDLADAFGGRVPSDEAPTAIGSAPPPPSRRSSRAAMAGQAHSAPPPGLPPPPPRASQPVPRSLPPQVITVPPGTPQLSLTERQSIPRLLKSMGEVSKLPIDHRAGFLLAHVDGMQTLEEILDVCAKLKGMGVIEFE
jgi:hypothetical protein